MVDIARLLASITALEDSHKRNPDMVTQLDLTNARRDLLQIFAERYLVAKNKGRFVHYSQANKCGRHLATHCTPVNSGNLSLLLIQPLKGN